MNGYVVHLRLPSDCFSEKVVHVCLWVCVCVCGGELGTAGRMDKEEGQKERVEGEKERGREGGRNEDKRGMRVILTRNDWWERGGGGECKHSECEGFHTILEKWFFRLAFIICCVLLILFYLDLL